MKPFMLDNEALKKLMTIGANDFSSPEQQEEEFPVGGMPPKYPTLADFAAEITPGGMSVGNPAQMPNMSVGEPAKVAPTTANPGTAPGIAVPQPKDNTELYKKLLSVPQAKATEENELRQLQDQAQGNREIALALQGLNQIAQGVSSGFGGKIGDGSGAVKQLMQMAGQPVTDYKTRQKDVMDKMAMDKAKAFAEPDSPLAMMMKDQLVKAFKVRPEMVQNMNATEMQTVFPWLNAEREYNRLREKALLDAQNKKDAKDKSDRKFQLAMTEAQRRHFQAAEKSGYRAAGKNYEEAQKGMQAFRQVRGLLDQLKTDKTGVTIAQIGPKLARALGEVGVLTEMDVTRYMSPAAWGGKLSTWLMKGGVGELPDDLKKDLLSNADKVVGIMEKDIGTIQERVIDAVDKTMQQFNSKMGGDAISREDIATRLGFGADYGKEQPSESSKMDEEAVKWAKENPDDPRSARILEINGVK